MTKHSEEKSLMEALRNGSIIAFDTIYQLYAPRVYAYCYQAMRSEAETEDLVQDVFTNIWLYHEAIDPERSLSTLIFTVAARYRANAFRKRINSLAYLEFIECGEEMAPSNGENFISFIDFKEAVKKAMSRFSGNQRKVIELAILQDMDNRTIAKKLSLNEKTIRNLLSIGRKQLRVILSEFLLFFPLASPIVFI